MKPKNRGIDHLRTKPAFFHVFSQTYINKEAIFAEMWEKENEPRSWLNFGYGILQDLFIRGGNCNYLYGKVARKGKTIIINNRERMITATAIQWLGSNCGWEFLCQTIDKCGYRLVKKSDNNT